MRATRDPRRVGNVEHPGARGTHLARIETRDGGVATTSRRRRRWQLADGTPVHHVVDPHRGRPGDVPWTSATALAATAVDAEVGATVTFLDGDPAGAPRVVAAVLADERGRSGVLGPHPELVATGTPAAA